MKVLQFIWFLVLASLLPGFVNNALGQDEEPPPPERSAFSSDRPSFTTGPDLMDPNTWQLELGYTYRDDAGDGDDDVGSFPETLVRYGLDDKIELRFGWDGYDFVDDADDRANDSFFGVKYALPGDWLSLGTDKMALIGTISVPTGSGESELDPQVLLGWSKNLNEAMTLSGNLGIGYPTDETTGDRFTQGVFSVMCARDMGSDTTLFGEYYTNFPAEDEEDAEHVLQAGVMHMIGPDTQLDFRTGIGLNDQADDWIVGIGISHRF